MLLNNSFNVTHTVNQYTRINEFSESCVDNITDYTFFYLHSAQKPSLYFQKVDNKDYEKNNFFDANKLK